MVPTDDIPAPKVQELSRNTWALAAGGNLPSYSVGYPTATVDAEEGPMWCPANLMNLKTLL
jgi:hypothetical protein